MGEPDTAGPEEARRIASEARDRVRFEEEALALADQVYRVARRFVSTREEAEDLVQDTYARAFRSWQSYTPGRTSAPGSSGSSRTSTSTAAAGCSADPTRPPSRSTTTTSRTGWPSRRASSASEAPKSTVRGDACDARARAGRRVREVDPVGLPDLGIHFETSGNTNDEPVPMIAVSVARRGGSCRAADDERDRDEGRERDAETVPSSCRFPPLSCRALRLTGARVAARGSRWASSGEHAVVGW